MFKDFEDYVIGAAAVYGLILVGKAAKDAYIEIKTTQEESGIEYIQLAGDRWSHVINKLNECNASKTAKMAAYEHCYMLLNRHIEFYCVNVEAKAKAHKFNDTYYQDLMKIW